MALFSGSSGGGQGSDDQATYVFWGAVFIVLVSIFVWYFKKQAVVNLFFHLRSFEIMLMLPLVRFFDWLQGLFHVSFFSSKPLLHWQVYMRTMSLTQITWSDIENMNTVVGLYLRWFVYVSVAFSIYYLLRHHRLARFNNIYNMKRLRDAESENWPQIRPILSTDLIKTPLDQGEWAMAKSPFYFCKMNNLLMAPSHIDGDDGWHVRSQEAGRLFHLQMGRHLPKDIRQLPIYMQALLMIFVLKADRKMTQAQDLLIQISRSAGHGSLNFSGVSELMAQYHSHRVVTWLRGRHAYVYTFMAGALELARSSGVAATSEFLWLKPLDRSLWYVLNSTGRNVCVIEAAGPFSHFLAEKRFKRALKVPMLKQACSALELAIHDILHIPESDQWHTSSAD